MFIYCDTNIYCRPFDDQSQPRIKAETEAFLDILQQVEENQITLVSSDVLVAEIDRIHNLSKRRLVELYLTHCGRHISASVRIVHVANELVKQCHLKPKDAFHIASAWGGRVRNFLTCDDRVVKKRELVSKTTKQMGFEVCVLNPLEFLGLIQSNDQREGE